MSFVIHVIWSQVAEHRHILILGMGMNICENTTHTFKMNSI